MNIKRIKDAGYKSPYSVAIKINGKSLSIREEGGQTKIFRNLQGGGDVYLYARQNSDGTFDLTYNDHSKYMQSRSANDNVEESLGTYGLVDVLNTMANFKGPVDDYFFARESSVADSRRVSDGEQYTDAESQEEYDYCKQTAKEIDNWLEYENGVSYNEVCAELESRGFVLSNRHGRGDTEQIWQVENNITTAGLYLSVVKGGTIAKYCDFTSNINKFNEDEWKMYSL
jgi:hypothetical protein